MYLTFADRKLTVMGQSTHGNVELPGKLHLIKNGLMPEPRARCVCAPESISAVENQKSRRIKIATQLSFLPHHQQLSPSITLYGWR
jgi:hypothetical protein